LKVKKRSFICRAFSKLRFRVLGLATIKGIPTYEFRDLIKTLKSEGWYVTYEYYGSDAWVHYGQVKLRHDLRRLNLEWDDKTGGSIEGAGDLIRGIAYTKGYKSVDQWRWAEESWTA
jgi:hypothetical protein